MARGIDFAFALAIPDLDRPSQDMANQGESQSKHTKGPSCAGKLLPPGIPRVHTAKRYSGDEALSVSGL